MMLRSTPDGTGALRDAVDLACLSTGSGLSPSKHWKKLRPVPVYYLQAGGATRAVFRVVPELGKDVYLGGG